MFFKTPVNYVKAVTPNLCTALKPTTNAETDAVVALAAGEREENLSTKPFKPLLAIESSSFIPDWSPVLSNAVSIII